MPASGSATAKIFGLPVLLLILAWTTAIFLPRWSATGLLIGHALAMAVALRARFPWQNIAAFFLLLGAAGALFAAWRDWNCGPPLGACLWFTSLASGRETCRVLLASFRTRSRFGHLLLAATTLLTVLQFTAAHRGAFMELWPIAPAALLSLIATTPFWIDKRPAPSPILHNAWLIWLSLTAALIFNLTAPG